MLNFILYLNESQSFYHSYEKQNIDFAFCCDLGGFSGIGFTQNLPVSFTIGSMLGTIAFSETKILLRNAKANANLHTWSVPWIALTPTVSPNVQES